MARVMFNTFGTDGFTQCVPYPVLNFAEATFIVASALAGGHNMESVFTDWISHDGTEPFAVTVPCSCGTCTDEVTLSYVP